MIPPTYLFDWMVEFGYINHTEDEKYEWYNKAIKQLLREYRFRYELNPSDKKSLLEYRHFKKRIEDNFIDLTDEEEVRITNCYKRISIINLHKNYNNDRTKSEDENLP